MNLLVKPAGILGIYVLLLAAIVIAFPQSSQYRSDLMWVHLIGFAMVAILSFLAVRGWRPALWIMGIYLIVHITIVALGVFLIPWKQYILKPSAVVIGSSFTSGGVMLIRRALQLRRASPNNGLHDETTHG